MSDGPYILYYLVAIVFVASSLIGLRQPIGKTMKMVIAWVAIFGVAFGLFVFRSEFSSLGQRLRAEATGAPMVEGQTVRIPISDDGHFWAEAKLNGRSVRFMVDSGASVTTVSRADAQDAGIKPGMQSAVVSTANGLIEVRRSRAERLAVGSIERTDFPVHVTDRDDVNLLGMNFLSSLRSWRVEGNYLVLES